MSSKLLPWCAGMNKLDRAIPVFSPRIARHPAWPTAMLAILAACAAPSGKPPPVQPLGTEKTGKTQALETGAALLQTQAPLRPMDVYLVGFHAAKENPSLQMEAHHYCRQVNEEFAQCALFDGNTEAANLIGIEYIISERLFDALPQSERKYWHPHNYEILSGELIAPGIRRCQPKYSMIVRPPSLRRKSRLAAISPIPGSPAGCNPSRGRRPPCCSPGTRHGSG
jgi:hypothetical protein